MTMNGGDNEDPPGGPGGEDERTVFQPMPTGMPFQPQGPQVPAQQDQTPSPLPGQTFAPVMAAAAAPRQIQPGDVLNHIFEVKRFIARGGMGEVFEGVNVNSDERVAIKVILPHLAADPNVQAMFRKEARTLTRLGHPALVQYRVLAQEPTFGVLYIVTEYVDGKNLSDVLRTIEYGPQDLSALTKRLAEGLQAAHTLGAIHRDISPDNVMLEGGTLSGAKVIDFGIAKDLDPGSATIVGDGFAGKLAYVAPEQLGDFGRDVGPWTDVYSLALVILAIALRKDVDMGGTLVDAVDKRRAGPDLSAIPDDLRPTIEKMLKPNPADRARSMGEVIEMLSGRAAPGQSPAPAPAPTPPKLKEPKPPKPPKEEKPPRLNPDGSPEDSWIKANMPLVAGGGGVLALVLAVGIWFALPGGDETPTGAASEAATEAVAPVGDIAATARTALNAGLPNVSCTWLDIVNIAAQDGAASIVLRGVAGKPAEAQGQISRFLTAKGVKVANIDFEEVSPIEASECGPLDAFRQIRDPVGGMMNSAQPKFEMAKLSDGEFAGTVAAQAVINFNINATSAASLFGLEPSGSIQQLAPDKASLEGATEPAGNIRRLQLDVNHTGWSGLLLLSGKGPFDASLIAGPPGSRSGDWSQRFLATAKQRGWKAEMAWFKTVDEVPN